MRPARVERRSYNTKRAMTAADRPTRVWSGFPPSRRFSVSALVAVLLFTVPGAAQAPRRPPTLSLFNVAARALIEGRYDEVDQITDKLDARDPAVAALKGTRRDRARTLRSGGRDPSADAAGRAPSSDGGARARSAAADARPPERAGDARQGRGARRHRDRRPRIWRARRGRCARSAAFSKPTPRIATPRPARAGRSGDQHGVGRAVPREIQHERKRRSRFRTCCRRTTSTCPRADRHGRDDQRRQSARGGRARAAGAQGEPVARSRRASSSRRQTVDEGHHDEARASLAKALAVNPSSLEAHAWLARARVRRGQEPGVRSRSREGARDRAELRRGVPHCR